MESKDLPKASPAEKKQVQKVGQDVNRDLNLTKSYIQRDPVKAKNAWVAASKTFADNKALLFNTIEGVELINKIQEDLDKYDAILSESVDKAVLTKAQSAVETNKKALLKAIEKAKADDIKSYAAKTKEALEKVRGELESIELGKKYLAEVEHLLEVEVPSSLGEASAAGEEKAYQKALDTPFKALQTAVKNKHASNIAKYQTELEGVWSKFASLAASNPQVQALETQSKGEVAALLQGASASANEVDVGKLIDRIQFLIKTVRNDVQKKKLKSAQSYYDTIQKEIVPLRASSNDAAVSFMKEYNAFEEEYVREVGSVLAEEEFAKAQKDIEFAQKTLRNAIANNKALSIIQKDRVKLEETLDKYRSSLSMSDHGRKLLSDTEAFLFQEVNALVGDVEAAGKLKELQTKVDFHTKTVNTALNKKELHKATKYRDNYVAYLDKVTGELTRFESCRQLLEKARGEIESLEQAFTELSIDTLVREKLPTAAHHLKWAEQYLDRGDVMEAEKHWEQAQELAAQLRKSIGGNARVLAEAEVAALFSAHDVLQASYAARVAQIRLEAAIKKGSEEMEPKIRWLESALEQQNPERTMELAQQLRELVAPFVAKFGDVSLAKQAVEKAEALLKRVDDEIKPMVEEKMVAKTISEAEFPLKEMLKNLEKKSVDGVSEFRDKLTPHVTLLKQNYATNATAQEFIAKAEAGMKQCDDQLGDILIDREIKKLSGDIVFQQKQLTKAYQDKNVSRCSAYREKLEALLVPLSRYEDREAAKTLLDSAKELIGRVEAEMGDMVAEAEIGVHGAKLAAKLKLFDQAMDNKNVEGVLKARETATEVALPLKSKYNGHPKAREVLTHLSTSLARCDKEIGALLAEREVSPVAAKCAHAVAMAQKAAANNDVRGALLQLQNVHRLAQPLSVKYPTFPKTQELMKQASDLSAALQPLLAASVQQDEVDKYYNQVADEVKKVTASVDAGKLMEASALLTGANKLAQPLRQRFAFVDKVQELLQKLDTFNLNVLGKIPEEEEGAPVLSIDFKLPSKEQSILRQIQSSYDDINRQLSAAAKVLSSSFDLPHNDERYGDVPFGLRDTSVLDIQYGGKLDDVVAELDNIEKKLLPSLLALKGETASDDYPTVVAIREADEPLRKLVASKKDVFNKKCRYYVAVDPIAQAMSEARYAQISYARNSVGEWKFSAHELLRLLRDVLDKCQKGMAKAKQVQSQFPDDCDSVTTAATVMEEWVADAQDKAREVSKEGVAAALKRSIRQMDPGMGDANEVYDDIKAVFGAQSTEAQELAQMIAEKDKAHLAKEEEENKIAEAKAAAFEAERVKRVDELETKLKKPFTSGTMQVGSQIWVYHESGQFNSDGPKWSWTSRYGYDMELLQSGAHWSKEGTAVIKGANEGKTEVSFAIDYRNAKGMICRSAFQKWAWDEKERTYASTIGDYQKWQFDADFKTIQLVQGAKGDCAADKATITAGSIPPVLILWALTYSAYAPYIVKFNKASAKFENLWDVEKSRRQVNSRQIPSSCPLCKRHVSRFNTCYNCGHWTCGGCGRHQSGACSGCRVYNDNSSSDPHHDWVHETKKMLAKKYELVHFPY